MELLKKNPNPIGQLIFHLLLCEEAVQKQTVLCFTTVKLKIFPLSVISKFDVPVFW